MNKKVNTEFQICSTRQVFLALVGLLLLSLASVATAKGKPGGDKGSGGSVEAVFHVNITGAFIGDQDSRPQSIKTGSKSVIFSPRLGTPMRFHLAQFWAEQDYAGESDGSVCFGDLINADYVNGSLHLNESEGSQIGIAAFWFRGGDDGPDTDTEIKYVIEFHDDLELGWISGDDYAYEFPPGSNPLSLTPTSWEMRTEGKGELKKGPCVAAGTFNENDIPEFLLRRVD